MNPLSNLGNGLFFVYSLETKINDTQKRHGPGVNARQAQMSWDAFFTFPSLRL
jgi:hypothetical protein